MVLHSSIRSEELTFYQFSDFCRLPSHQRKFRHHLTIISFLGKCFGCILIHLGSYNVFFGGCILHYFVYSTYTNGCNITLIKDILSGQIALGVCQSFTRLQNQQGQCSSQQCININNIHENERHCNCISNGVEMPAVALHYPIKSSSKARRFGGCNFVRRHVLSF